MWEMTRIETDACWRELFPHPRYSPEESDAVFQDVVKRTRKALSLGRSVVVEGVFASQARLDALDYLAEAHRARLVVIGVACTEGLAFDRMTARSLSSGGGVVTRELWSTLSHSLTSWGEDQRITWLDSTYTTPPLLAATVSAILSESFDLS
jgi:predicted kinase